MGELSDTLPTTVAGSHDAHNSALCLHRQSERLVFNLTGAGAHVAASDSSVVGTTARVAQTVRQSTREVSTRTPSLHRHAHRRKQICCQYIWQHSIQDTAWGKLGRTAAAGAAGAPKVPGAPPNGPPIGAAGGVPAPLLPPPNMPPARPIPALPNSNHNCSTSLSHQKVKTTIGTAQELAPHMCCCINCCACGFAKACCIKPGFFQCARP